MHSSPVWFVDSERCENCYYRFGGVGECEFAYGHFHFINTVVFFVRLSHLFVNFTTCAQILNVGEDEATATGTHNQMATFVAEAEGLNKIEDLQQHSNNDIYEKCVKILETYFGVDEEEEMANIVPDMAEDGNQFAFSAPSNGMDDEDGGSAPTFDFSG